MCLILILQFFVAKELIRGQLTVQCQPLPTLEFLRQLSSEKSPQINSFDKDTVPIVQLITMTMIVCMKDNGLQNPAENYTPHPNFQLRSFGRNISDVFELCLHWVSIFCDCVQQHQETYSQYLQNYI